MRIPIEEDVRYRLGDLTFDGTEVARADAVRAQFEIEDKRTPEEVINAIKEKGYDPVWKDWDPSFLSKDPIAS